MRRLLVLAFLAAHPCGAVAADFPDYLVIRDRLGPRDIGGGRQSSLDLLVRIVDEHGVVRFEEVHCGREIGGLDGELELALGTVDPAANPLALDFDGSWSVEITACEEAACEAGPPGVAGSCAGELVLAKPLDVVAYAWRARRAAKADTAMFAEDCDRLDGLDASAFMPASADDWVDEGGDVMTGPLTLPAAPVEDLHAATKRYVDEQVRNAIPSGYAILGLSTTSPGGFTAPGDFIWEGGGALQLPDTPAAGHSSAAAVGAVLYASFELDPGVLWTWSDGGGAWAALAAPSSTRGELVAVGDRVHVLSIDHSHWAYEPATDAWRRHAAPPVHRDAARAYGGHEGTLFMLVSAGSSGSDHWDAAFWRYDAAAGTWIPGTPPRGDHPGVAMASFDGALWAVGGSGRFGFSSVNRETWSFEESTGTWQEGPRLKRSLPWHAGVHPVRAVVLAGRLWVIAPGGGGEGGLDFGHGWAELSVQAIGTGETSWERVPAPDLVDRWHFGAASLGDRVHVVGGAARRDGDAFRDHEAWSPPRKWHVHVRD